MSTEHDEITTLLRRAADEYPVDADALWARTRDRVDAATSGNARTGPATRSSREP